MKAIDYSIKAYYPQTHPEHPIEFIQSRNREFYTQFEGHSVVIELEFTPSVIDSISIGLMTSTKLHIVAYTSPDQTDPVNLLEKKIPKFSEHVKTYLYKASDCFPNYQDFPFCGMKLEIDNLEERRSFNINYIQLLAPKQVMQDTSPPPARSNLNKSSFITPAASKSTDKCFKQSTLPEFYTNESNNESDTLIVSNSVEEALQNSPEIAKQQNRLISSIKKIHKTGVSSKKKKLTNSYSDLLNGYLVSCVVNDEMMKYEVIQLCEVLGAVYIEDLEDRPRYVISDGSDIELLEKLQSQDMQIVSIEWLRECLIRKELVPIEIYLVY